MYSVLLVCIMVWLEYIYLRNYNIHKLLNPDVYNQPFLSSRLSLGKMSFTRKKKIVFAGLARNIESKIKKNVDNCVLMGTFFKDYKIVIFENDSHDKTREYLEEMAKKNENIQLIDCKSHPKCIFDENELYDYGLMNIDRIDRMTFYRNIYLSIVYKYFSDYDYMCVMDFDIDGLLTINGLIHALKCPFEWSCICANGRSGIPGTFGMLDTMYDAMAFCLTEYDLKLAKNGCRAFSHLFYKYLRLIWLSSFDSGRFGFVSVISAFNGVSIYKIDDIYGLYYKKGYSCEHISLHEQMIEKGKKIWIDLELSLYVGHQGPRRIQDFLK